MLHALMFFNTRGHKIIRFAGSKKAAAVATAFLKRETLRY